MTSAQEQYRSIVRHYLQGGQISPTAQRILERQRSHLNLLTDEAKAIEQSVLEGSSDLEGSPEKDDRKQDRTQATVYPAQSRPQPPADAASFSSREGGLPNRESNELTADHQLAKDSSFADAIPTVEDIAPMQESPPADAIPTVEDISPDAENGGTADRPSESRPQEASEPPKSEFVPESAPESAPESNIKFDTESVPKLAPESAPDSNTESASHYRTAYAQAVRLLFPPNQPQNHSLNELLKLGLRSLQQSLNLQDNDVKAIEMRCLEEFEAEQQQYQRNLTLYQEEFASARSSLHRESVQNELWQLQHKLGLRGEDVLKLERDVMQEKPTEADRDLLTMNSHSPDLARGQAIEKVLFNNFDDTDTVNRSGQTHNLRPHTDPQKIVLQAAGAPADYPTDREVSDQLIVGASSMDDNLGDWDGEQSEQQTASINLDGSNRSANVNLSGSQVGSQVDPQASSQTGSQAVPLTVLESIRQTELEDAFQKLAESLSSESQDWWQADQITYQILLKLSPTASSDWLDTTSIKQINPLDALRRIDRLWSDASEGRFGLSAQRDVYNRVEQELRLQYLDKMKDDRLQQLYIQEFVREIGWWDSRLKFVKFYRWLSFEADLTVAPDIPQGQFPAYWFWVIPGKYALQLGGIGFGQGGWRIDTSRMQAWINKLKNL